jgi:hypothetical protein
MTNIQSEERSEATTNKHGTYSDSDPDPGTYYILFYTSVRTQARMVS